jgi:four helix bundle protein
MHNFREMKIWQRSRLLVKEIYLLTQNFPSGEKFGLTAQIQRSSVSIPSNIAEGSGRGTNKEFARFLDIAYSSAYELETQVILANDLNYINDIDLDKITKELFEIQKMIFTFYK